MKLLLTSNGFTPKIADALKAVLEKSLEHSSVGFITTAAFGEEDGPEWNTKEWLAEHKRKLQEQNITQIEDIDVKDMDEKTLEEKILGKDILYINGGNTFYLMYWIKKRKLESVIKNFLKNGGIYIGVSAGSIIACSSIESAGWEPADKNNVNLTDLKGLNLVSFLIHPHFELTQMEQIKDTAAKTSYPIIALTNEQAILINQEKIELVGEETTYFFNGFSEKQ